MFLRLAQNYETLKSKSKTTQEMGLSRVLLKHSGKVLNTLLKHQRKPPPLNSKVAWECVKSAIQLISPSQLNFHHDLLKRGNTNVLKVVFSHSWKADQAKLSSLADGRWTGAKTSNTTTHAAHLLLALFLVSEPSFLTGKWAVMWPLGIYLYHQTTTLDQTFLPFFGDSWGENGGRRKKAPFFKYKIKKLRNLQNIARYAGICFEMYRIARVALFPLVWTAYPGDTWW